MNGAEADDADCRPAVDACYQPTTKHTHTYKHSYVKQKKTSAVRIVFFHFESNRIVIVTSVSKVNNICIVQTDLREMAPY